jgi:predicted DsbA family dithiol-disulfide isomerase
LKSAAGGRISFCMNIPAVSGVVPHTRQLTVDVVADFTCPWSFLGIRRIALALGNVQGQPLPALLRWHGLRLPRAAAVGNSAWRTHLAARLPPGVTAELAERSLETAGQELGIRFDFAAIDRIPDTSDAHRLTLLAAQEGLHAQVADGIFRAYFERGLDIAAPQVLAEVGQAAGLSVATLAAFADVSAERAELDSDERRLQALGVVNVPNLLLNGHVLVPGSADVATYVQALDAALFPGVGLTPANPQQLN